MVRKTSRATQGRDALAAVYLEAVPRGQFLLIVVTQILSRRSTVGSPKASTPPI
jgi:hypothetical protein